MVSKTFFLSVDLTTPSINYTRSTSKDEIYNVTVWWTKDDCTPNDVEYIVSVTNSSSPGPMYHVKTLMQLNLTLYCGIEYNITVTAQLCSGRIKSETSNQLRLYSNCNSKSLEMPCMGISALILQHQTH